MSMAMTSSMPMPTSLGVTAVHSLPTVLNKPRVIVSNGAQVLLNGPTGSTSAPVINGAHIEVKKENGANSGRWTLQFYISQNGYFSIFSYISKILNESTEVSSPLIRLHQ